MLTREALDAAIPLATRLDEKNVFLMAVENTPLEALVRATRSDIMPAKPVPTDGSRPLMDLDGILYMANCKDRLTGICDHDDALDRFVEMGVNGVRGHVDFARNTVAAAVTDLVDRTNEALRSLSPSTLLGMEVVVHAMPAPLELAQLENSIERFAAASPVEPRLSARLPQLPYTELLELMGSGAGGVDKEVQAWLATMGESFLTSLWEAVFTQKPVGLNARAVTFNTFVQDRVNGVANALAIFLLARKLVEQPIEGVEMPLQAFENLMAEFRNQAALRLKYALEEQARIVKNGELVRMSDARVTVVNEKVYRAWIEAGGDNEVLFGNQLQARPFMMQRDLDDNSVTLKAAWTRHALLTATIENNRKFSRTKEILDQQFRAQLKEITADDAIVQGNAELVLSKFRSELAAAKEGDLQDLYSLCLKLVCRSRFPHTAAEELLCTIQRVQCENPKIDVREAAAIAVLKYIACWVATQFKVRSR
ncbi:hypothetical protein D3C71_78410 [compost metagenome]